MVRVFWNKTKLVQTGKTLQIVVVVVYVCVCVYIYILKQWPMWRYIFFINGVMGLVFAEIIGKFVEKALKVDLLFRIYSIFAT